MKPKPHKQPDKPKDPARVFASQWFFLALHQAVDDTKLAREVLRESLETYARMAQEPGFPRQEWS